MRANEETDKTGLVRMATAREAVPRKDDESRAQWKERVFDWKRKEEEKHGHRYVTKDKGKK